MITKHIRKIRSYEGGTHWER